MKDSISRIWMYKYSLTCEYFKEHGNLLIPRNYSLEVNGNIVNLGSWLNKQRQYYKENKLNNEQISLLNEIGMIWRLNKAKESKNDELSYNWMKNYELAKKYYEEYGNLLIPRKYEVIFDNKIIKLGYWICNQRSFYKEKKLNESQIELLNKIGMMWGAKLYKEKVIKKPISNIWMKNYEIAKQYYESKGNLLIAQKYYLTINDEKINLGNWISQQRSLYKKGKLNEKQIELLNKIGMIWKVIIYDNEEEISYSWMKNYELAKKYYKEHGNLLIPFDYQVIDNDKVIRLGYWINTQRQAYKNNKLNENQIELLNKIGMIWSFKLVKEDIRKEYTSDKWMQNYNLARKYYEEYGNLLIPRKYEVVFDNKVIKLGVWLNTQRYNYSNRSLNNSQIELLNKIGMIWRLNKAKESNNDELSYNWMKNYELAKKYYEEHDNLLIPQKYYLTINDEKINLGRWIVNQRQAYKNNKLNKNEIELLNKIGMVWSLKLSRENIKKDYISNIWMKNYEIAKKYYEVNGNLLIAQKYYLTIYDEKINLGNWISRQRSLYKEGKLNEKQIELLNKIGMVWNAKLFKEKSIKKPISNIWMKNYKLAKAYYQKYENLLIKINYEIVVDDKVVKLGNWIHNQRQAYKNNKLNEEQIELLNEINMIWCLRAYKDYLKQIDRYLNNESIRYTDDTALNTIKTIKEKVL